MQSSEMKVAHPKEESICEGYAVLQRPRVLLAEDEPEMRRLLASTLRKDGFDVIEARDGRDLIRLIKEQILRGNDKPGVDLIVSDIRMPGPSGLRVLAALRRVEWATPVLLITAFGDAQTHAEAERLGAVAVIDKPFDLNVFRRAVGSIISQP